MMTAIRSDRIILADGLLDGYVYYSDGKILEVSAEKKPCDSLLDCKGLYVSPGFIDLHTHGGKGIAFDNCTLEEAVQCCEFHMQHGTTTLLPTFSAAPIGEMERSSQLIGQVMDGGEAPVCIPGVHMEGPYLSANQAGAQRPGVITPPIAQDYLPLTERCGKYIRRWSYAPENDKAQAFARHLKEHGILASAGHTDARYEELEPAFRQGCSLITHLYSCTSTVTREKGFRHLGVIETAWLLPEMDVEIIADGKHLPPELISMIVRIKGREHVALCTDSLPPAGLDVKEGIMSGTPYVVEDGVAKLPDRSAFAGSIATTDRLVRVLTKECGISLFDAVYMMSTTPARILGLPKGKLEAGMDADIIVFDDDIQVQTVITGGIRRI